MYVLCYTPIKQKLSLNLFKGQNLNYLHAFVYLLLKNLDISVHKIIDIIIKTLKIFQIGVKIKFLKIHISGTLILDKWGL